MSFPFPPLWVAAWLDSTTALPPPSAPECHFVSTHGARVESVESAPPGGVLLAAPSVVSSPPTSDRPTVQATRLEGGVTVDGALEEDVWRNGTPFTELVQRDPVEGVSPSQRTEVRVAYDDDALYVGARLYDTAPDSIVTRLARRDASIASDRFAVYLDPYYDRRSGYYFMVNAAGTLYDGTLSNDVEEDKSWDGIWEGIARTDEQGWTVEMRIPYSQLRFSKNAPGVWGINVAREIPRRRERAYAAYRPRKASGFVSRFPDLVGIETGASRQAIELLPYVTTRNEQLEHENGDPFNDGSRGRASAGADMRTRVGGLTLSATVNPDFGQVEVDPATVNLSDVEDFLEEKRPFFIDGASTYQFGRQGAGDYWDYDWDEPLFFYSRRIGRAPQGRVPRAEYSDVPVATGILGAAKLSGRLNKAWSLGTLHAVTRREVAQLANPDRTWDTEIEPLTYYGVTRAQREFRGRKAGLGVLGTAAARSFDDPRLRAQLNSASFMGGVDGWVFLDPDETWVLSGWSALSNVQGTPQRMVSLQRSSTHYFQRPDANHVEVDSSATSMSGFASRYWINKQKGATQVNLGLGFVSPAFNVNDLGFQRRSDLVNSHLGTGYKWTRGTRYWRYQTLKTTLYGTYDLGGNRIRRGLQASGYTEFHNGSALSYFVTRDAQALNNRRTRGGPIMVEPASVGYGFDALTDTQKRTYYFLSLGGETSPSGSSYLYAYPGVEWKPTSTFSMKFTPGWEHLREDAQYVTTISDTSAAYGRREVFATLDQKTLSTSLRFNWTFSPRLSLQSYIQPFISSASYRDYKGLAQPGTYEFIPVAAQPNSDFTVRSLKGNAVLRWEYRPGSLLFLVWTQDRSETDPVADFYLQPGRVADARPENVFLIKASYYFTR